MKLQQCINETYCLPEAPQVVYGLRGSTADIYLDNAAYRKFLFKELNVSTVDEESAAIVMVSIWKEVFHLMILGKIVCYSVCHVGRCADISIKWSALHCVSWRIWFGWRGGEAVVDKPEFSGCCECSHCCGCVYRIIWGRSGCQRPLKVNALSILRVGKDCSSVLCRLNWCLSTIKYTPFFLVKIHEKISMRTILYHKGQSPYANWAFSPLGFHEHLLDVEIGSGWLRLDSGLLPIIVFIHSLSLSLWLAVRKGAFFLDKMLGKRKRREGQTTSNLSCSMGYWLLFFWFLGCFFQKKKKVQSLHYSENKQVVCIYRRNSKWSSKHNKEFDSWVLLPPQ